MAVTNAQVAALRAFLMRDPGQSVILVSGLGGQGTPGYLHLAEAALSVAAVHQFPRFTSADLVRFVAAVRSSRIADGDEYDLDPAIAESVLAYFLGQKNARLPGPDQRVHAVMALLGALTQDYPPRETGIDNLLQEAQQLADHWNGGV
jgi:hypothetical protein